MLDEICVDNRVEQVVIDGVIHMCILIIIAPVCIISLDSSRFRSMAACALTNVCGRKGSMGTWIDDAFSDLYRQPYA